MKLLTLVAFCRHEAPLIDTLQPAMQLAARTTDTHEMAELRKEVRDNSFRDTTPLSEIEERLSYTKKALEEEMNRRILLHNSYN